MRIRFDGQDQVYDVNEAEVDVVKLKELLEYDIKEKIYGDVEFRILGYVFTEKLDAFYQRHSVSVEDICTIKYEVKYSVTRSDLMVGSVCADERQCGLYHHVYCVTDGEMITTGGVPKFHVTEIIELDPVETDIGGTSLTTTQLIQGVDCKPRCSRNVSLINMVFGKSDLKIIPGYGTVANNHILEIQKRAAEAKDSTVTYRLHTFNCQHFATYISTGVAKSFEINAIVEAIFPALQGAMENGLHFVNHSMRPALAYQPFDNNHTLGWIGNVICTLVILVIMLLVLMLICTLSFGGHACLNYFRRRDKHIDSGPPSDEEDTTDVGDI